MSDMNLRELWKKYREIVSYLFFGGATTLVNWVIYAVCVRVTGGALTASNAAAWLGAVLFAFVVNKIFVFQSKSRGAADILREAVLFFGSRAATGVLEIFLPGLLYRIGLDQAIFGVEGFAAKIVVSVAVIVLNYVFSKLLIFRKKD